MAKKKKDTLNVMDISVTLQYVENEEYLSLTDMAKGYAERGRTDMILQRWLRNGSTIDFLEVWETHNNPVFNPSHLEGIRSNLLSNSTIFSVKGWIEKTNAIGIQARAGRYGGTYAHIDIAFEFATWLDAKFKYYLIKEFKRLKVKESRRQSLNWDLKRELTKINYRLHAETVRRFLVPKGWEGKYKVSGIYANEADMFNVAVFGMTAQEWKDNYPEEKGNLRDNATELELTILNNLQAINSELIRERIPAEDRLLRLRVIAQYQIVVLGEDSGVKKLRPPGGIE